VVTVFAGIVFVGSAILAASSKVKYTRTSKLYDKELMETRKAYRERDEQLARLKQAKDEYEAIKWDDPLD
jgi:hypothetical protein